MPSVIQKSLAANKVRAYFKIAQENEKLSAALIVFLGALFLLNSVPFYPVYLAVLLAGACGAAAYSRPWTGTLLSVLFALPAVAYQSPVLAWVSLILLAITLIEMFEYWAVISALQILVLAPFAFSASPLFGWISMLGMTIAAMRLGSKKSLAISLPTVLMIMFISSAWFIQNSAFIEIKSYLYKPAYEGFMLSKKAVDTLEVPLAAFNAMASLLQFDIIREFNNAVGYTLRNFIAILVYDTGPFQVATWGIALYAVTYISGSVSGRRRQVIAAFALFLLVPAYFMIGVVFGTPFRIELAYSIAATVVAIGIAEQFGIMITRESEARRESKMKIFGKFGMKDIGAGTGEKGLSEVGGYEDVKQELRDAILIPLEKKELAYAYNIKPPSGILLFGPPGTGKTMLMRALAKELKYSFIEVKCSEILSQWYGESLPYGEKMIIRENGEVKMREIGEIVEKEQKAEVLAFNEHGKAAFAKIKGWIKHRASSPIYEVRTKTGRKIKVTAYHSLFGLRGTRIEAIKTSELVPKESYIAIPKSIPENNSPAVEIDFIERLRNEDYGLMVKNGAGYARKAIEKLGKDEVARISGGRQKLKSILNGKAGIRVNVFAQLMERAGLSYRKEDVMIGRVNCLPGIIKIDEKFATFLGLWAAEGSYNKEHVVRISTSEKEVGYIGKICEGLFGKITIYKKKNSLGRDICICSRPLYVLLRKILGLEDGAQNKKIPEISFTLSRANIAAVLRGYFSGDGNLQFNQRGIVTVEASTASEKLASDVMYLLLHFGIIASVHGKKEWNGNISKRISLGGYEKLRAFSEIGFMDGGKSRAISDYIKRIGPGWHRSDVVPITEGMRKCVVERAPNYGYGNKAIGKDVLASSGLEEEFEFVEHIQNDIYLDRVEEITKIADEDFVYDVSVEPCQNFVAGFGGIFAHNSEKNVSEVFENARKQAPVILFFDEIDSIGKSRTAGGTDDVTPRVLSVILQEMDGAVKSKKKVMVIGTTNVPQQLDSALLRPGRFDKIIYMHLPDREARKEIFKVCMREIAAHGAVGEDVDFDKLAAKTERFSGADIKNVVQEAIKKAAKEASAKGEIVPMSMHHILPILEEVRPSTGIAALDSYEQFKLDFERRVGAKKEEKEGESIKWSDVAGLEKVKDSLLKAIQLPLLYEKEMKELKIRPYKGVLLFGPPGTGKTLIVKAAGNELKASFQTISGAEIMKKGYTQAVSVIKETFNRARENTPAIIFVDEVETFAPARGGASSEILGQFLTEMDGVKELKGVLVIAATNKPSLLDSALLRPGRFDKIFYIPPPTAKDRVEIFRIHLGKFADEVDLKQLADASEGYSGADIAATCNELKFRALEEKIAGREYHPVTGAVVEMIAKRKPSINRALLEEYREFLEDYGERG